MHTKANKHDASDEGDRQDLDFVLNERHVRIKSQRQAFLSTVIGLSGGAIVLSASLLEKLAPQRSALWLLISSWGFLVLSLLCGIFALLKMIAHSMQYQRFLERKAKEDGVIAWLTGIPLRKRYIARSRSKSIAPEYSVGCLFVIGILLLGAFVVVNLLAT